MTVQITLIYAGAIAVLMAVLSTMTALKRGETGIALGDGDNATMALAVRRFGNLSEYAAMAIVLLLLMELAGISPFWLHAYGISFLVVRLLHPFILFGEMDAPRLKKIGRFVSGAGTAALLLTGGITLCAAVLFSA